ncbi:MAG TPA: TetR/AcrR family transcriptional regulator [Roseiarcus sp.]|nr:TetR/AcrR family transcriptional regulator [Roseiarcus sp.]
MPSRAYSSPSRDAAAAAKRARILSAASRLLGETENAALVSMEAVAKAAGVTRLTVYKQFGSRRGLLEAVFDERARLGGLGGILDALNLGDPRTGLDRIIEIFCDFWSADPSVGRLHDVAPLDPEFAQAVTERNERRRKALGALIDRLPRAGAKTPIDRVGAVDLIYALTSYPTYKALAGGRSKEAVCALLKVASRALLASIEAGAR